MKILNVIGCCFISIFCCSCYDDFLDIKSDKKLAVPATLNDFEALMDNVNVMNHNSVLILGEIGSDDYLLQEQDWNRLTNPYQKNGYIWAKNIYEGQQCIGWNNSYQKVLYTNIVLEGLDKIADDNKGNQQWQRIKGTALFWRSWQFYQLAQIFCDNYESKSAAQTAGVPLRLSSDISKVTSRTTVEETYRQILSDLKESLLLLPQESTFKTRPSKHAVYALLSRIYLQMGDYQMAKESADLCLGVEDELLDYNLFTGIDNFVFPLYTEGNREQLIYEAMIRTQLFVSFLKVNDSLLSSYHNDDLRKDIYFRSVNGYYQFKGTYNGFDAFNPFPALDEVYLIRAEANARLGNAVLAIDDLNYLLKNRFREGMYEEISGADSQGIISRIKLERRKSLIFRGVRWSDLRRFESIGESEGPLTRKLGKETYTLSSKQYYTWPIPEDVVTLSNIYQNPR